MPLTVVIPWRAGCDHRARALGWVLAQYRAHHPDWRIALTETPDGPWVKANAVMPAIESAPAGPVIVADADTWTDDLQAAVTQIQRGAPWAIPHRLVHRLNEHGADQVLAGANWRAQPVAQKPYPGLPGGGYVVADRDALLAVPMDPRFVGWGQEDESWARALTTLLGQPWRGDADLVHLWHPPQERLSRRHGSREGWQLRRRYLMARHDPSAMQRLIEEAKHALTSSEPPVHDLAP